MVNTVKSRKTLVISGTAILLLLLWVLLPRNGYQNLPYGDPSLSSDSTSQQCIASPGRPSIQYAVVIDAGSSGSRVHVYKFRYCKDEPELLDEVFRMLKPGLSDYKDDPEAAARSLDELMDVAVDSVPSELHHCTPVAVKATAGLRMIGEEKSQLILKAVRTRLETSYPFPIQEGEYGIATIDGKDEGVFAWITVNYLLGKLKKSQRGNSVAVFDLGGGSTQVVFEPSFGQEERLVEGEHKYILEYQKGNYELYQHSYLGYGLNEARKRIKNEVIDTWKDVALETGKVFHPCLPENFTETVGWDYEGKSHTVTLVGTGAGHAACRGVVERIFNKDKACAISPCAFDGIYQPPFAETFTARDLYVLSFFYDLTEPLGMPTEFSVQELGDLAYQVCAGETKRFSHLPGSAQTLQDNPNYCLELTYIHGLLRIGYEIPTERLVRTAKKINGVETGWCLGAAIDMIDGVTVCRVS